MAGTVVVDAVKSSTTGAPTFQNTSGTEIGQLCRAWVNFNGTGTVAIRASFNVSSITDNGTGEYTVNFTNAMSDANYAITGTTSTDGVTYNGFLLAPGNSDRNTNNCKVVSIAGTGAGGTSYDAPAVSVAIFR